MKNQSGGGLWWWYGVGSGPEMGIPISRKLILFFVFCF